MRTSTSFLVMTISMSLMFMFVITTVEAVRTIMSSLSMNKERKLDASVYSIPAINEMREKLVPLASASSPGAYNSSGSSLVELVMDEKQASNIYKQSSSGSASLRKEIITKNAKQANANAAPEHRITINDEENEEIKENPKKGFIRAKTAMRHVSKVAFPMVQVAGALYAGYYTAQKLSGALLGKK